MRGPSTRSRGGKDASYDSSVGGGSGSALSSGALYDPLALQLVLERLSPTDVVKSFEGACKAWMVAARRDDLWLSLLRRLHPALAATLLDSGGGCAVPGACRRFALGLGQGWGTSAVCHSAFE